MGTRRKVEKMGYFKNLEVELQEIQDDELREIVAWDHAHRHLLSPEERWRILTNEVLLKRALVLWSNETLSPKPARDHVALQQEALRRMRHRKPQRSGMCVAGWVMIIASLGAGIGILVVNL
jgi:hypothetical protein